MARGGIGTPIARWHSGWLQVRPPAIDASNETARSAGSVGMFRPASRRRETRLKRIREAKQAVEQRAKEETEAEGNPFEEPGRHSAWP